MPEAAVSKSAVPEPIARGPVYTVRRLVVSVCLLSLVGCAGILSQTGKSIDPEQGWTEQVQHQLGARVQARWDALITGNLDQAYEFETPAYRSVFSIQQYRGRFGSAVGWRSARVLSTKYDGNHTAAVSVAVEYEALISGAGNVRSVREMSEKWLYSDGEWWYISQ